MRTANTHKNMARCAATATLACVLGLGLVAPAYADTASDLAAARTKLEQIGTQTQQIHEELSAQTQELDQTAGEITQKQQEIAEGQAKLSSYVAGEYKTGGLSLLQVLTGVDDLGDMLNRLFYYGKVSDKQAQTIQEVKDLKQQLTDKQTEQEKNVAATQKKVDELNAQLVGPFSHGLAVLGGKGAGIIRLGELVGRDEVLVELLLEGGEFIGDVGLGLGL